MQLVFFLYQTDLIMSLPGLLGNFDLLIFAVGFA